MGLFLFLVVQDEETGIWYQHKGRDFKVPLLDYHGEGGNIVGTKKGLGLWPGRRGPFVISILFLFIWLRIILSLLFNLSYLFIQTFPSSCVRTDPLMNHVCFTKNKIVVVFLGSSHWAE